MTANYGDLTLTVDYYNIKLEDRLYSVSTRDVSTTVVTDPQADGYDAYQNYLALAENMSSILAGGYIVKSLSHSHNIHFIFFGTKTSYFHKQKLVNNTMISVANVFHQAEHSGRN